MPRHILSTNSLVANKVTNTAGEELVKIEELMIDVDAGQIAYAVLSFGGFLGFGNKLFAVPWSALHLDAEKEVFVFPITREKLQQAPGFDKDNWPRAADPYWDVHVYYGIKPHWEKA
jgi:sporulation protein YlmC with PRC-barrel domain